MDDNAMRFDDGARYERMMGRWSLLAGERFIDWLELPAGQRWLDVGCGTGAFTELLVRRCAPARVQAFDPAAGQLDFARQRLAPDAPVTWGEAGAEALPVADAGADAAVMALVLFFLPDPAAGVAEMCRAVRPGGSVAAYHWDMAGDGFPLADLWHEMRALDLPPRLPPSSDASTLAASAALWEAAGLRRVRVTAISVQRHFESFEDYWVAAIGSNSLRPVLAAQSAERVETLKSNVRRRIDPDGGAFSINARANAVCGVVG